MNPESRTKGRGAQHNPTNRFAAHSYEMRNDYLEYCLDSCYGIQFR